MEDDLVKTNANKTIKSININIFENIRLTQFSLKLKTTTMQPKTIKSKTMVVAPLRVT
jgi:hypothetical protein